MNAKKIASSKRSKEPAFSAIGAKMRAARAVLDWSQTDLRLQAGVTQRGVYGIESGLNQPRAATELRILKALKTSGLTIEDMSDGGFTLTVPGAYLRRHGKKRIG
jgi:transcriptional regulator with XRE-family HTH domain